MLSAEGAQRLYRSGKVSAETAWPGTCILYRSGNVVLLTGSNMRPQATGTSNVLQLPFGFRPAERTQGSASEGDDPRPIIALNYSPFNVQIRGVKTVNSWMDFAVVFITNDAIPEM